MTGSLCYTTDYWFRWRRLHSCSSLIHRVHILGWQAETVSHGLAWPRLTLLMMHWCIYRIIQQFGSTRIVMLFRALLG
jgi:hypothetical protein